MDTWGRALGRRITRRRFLRTSAISAGLGSLVLLGCREQAAVETPGQETAETPRQGGITRLVMSATEPANLNVARAGVHAVVHAGFVYSRLFRFKTGPDPAEYARYELVPDLATSVEIPEPTTVIFKLRPNVRWHDAPPTNGRPFTSEDVKFHFDTYKQSGARRSDIRYIASIEAQDPTTVVFKLGEARSDFIPYTAYPSTSYIVPREVWTSDTAWDSTPRGTGPFIFERWDKGTGIFYRKNPNYYEQSLPYVDNVEALVIGDNRTIIARMRTGELDWVYDVLSAQEVEASGLRQKIYAPNPSGLTLAFDGKPPFNDPRVRQAVQLAIDRKSLIDRFHLGKGITLAPMMSGALTTRWGLAEDDPVWRQWVTYDPQRARQLLSSAGATGATVQFNLTSGYGESFVTEAQAVASFLDAIGLRTEMKIWEYGDYIANVLRGPRGYSGILYASVTPYTDPTYYFEIHLDVQNSAYNFRTGDDEAYRLYQRQKAAFNEEERRTIIRDLLRRVVEQALFPPMVQGFQATPVADRVRSFFYCGSFSFGTDTVARYWLVS